MIKACKLRDEIFQWYYASNYVCTQNSYLQNYSLNWVNVTSALQLAQLVIHNFHQIANFWSSTTRCCVNIIVSFYKAWNTSMCETVSTPDTATYFKKDTTPCGGYITIANWREHFQFYLPFSGYQLPWPDNTFENVSTDINSTKN